MARSLVVKNGLDLEAKFSTIGAGLIGLTYKGTPVLLQPKSLDVFNNSTHYYGKTLGRVCGRIPSHINIGKHEYDLVSNEEGGINCHSSGIESLSFKKWNVYIANKPQGNYVIFTYNSKDGESGLPGDVEFKVTYFLPADRNEIQVFQKARSSQDTPINMSFHPYFNLGMEDDINDYTLQIKASKCGVFRKNTLLIEKNDKVPSYLDFRKPSKIKGKMDKLNKTISFPNTIDHFFLFDEVNAEQPQIVLSNGKTKLEVLTDYEGTNIYVDCSMSDEEFININKITNRRAIAIEPQNDRIPFSSMILKAGQRYSHFITYRFSDEN